MMDVAYRPLTFRPVRAQLGLRVGLLGLSAQLPRLVTPGFEPRLTRMGK
jgi:hypothetical protein